MSVSSSTPALCLRGVVCCAQKPRSSQSILMRTMATASPTTTVHDVPPATQQTFTLRSKSSSSPSPRLGTLSFPSRDTISTPHYIALGSRGTVPHLTPDVQRSSTSISAVYAGFEDFAEAIPRDPPFYRLARSSQDPTSSSSSSSSSSALRQFSALSPSTLLILGPRRHPCIAPPSINSYTSLSICTSVGFRQLEISSYISAVSKCGADISIGAVDVDLGLRHNTSGEDGKTQSTTTVKKPGAKRRDRMVERSTAWMRGLLAAPPSAGASQLWAPILPLDKEVQTSYLEVVQDGTSQGKVRGTVLYDNASLDALPAEMSSLPKLALTDPRTPAEVLDLVGLGLDLIGLPFITRASEAGVGFVFTFPASPSPSTGEHTSPPTAEKKEEEVQKDKVLGIDMWSPDFAQDARPLAPRCTCYACANHHRVYVQHLLQAKEMLAWVLLQIHNHHVMDAFFAGIRESIARGSFEEDVELWKRVYRSEWPAFVGQGPRIRGYQSTTSAGAGLPKKNRSPFTKLARKEEGPYRQDDREERLKESGEDKPMDPGTDAVDFEEIGFAEVFDTTEK